MVYMLICSIYCYNKRIFQIRLLNTKLSPIFATDNMFEK